MKRAGLGPFGISPAKSRQEIKDEMRVWTRAELLASVHSSPRTRIR
jgi:hypothetical protein